MVYYIFPAALLVIFTLIISECSSVEVRSAFSVAGLRGTVRLQQDSVDHNVTIQLQVATLDEKANGTYTVHVTEFPVDYTQPNYCSRAELGKILYRLDDIGDVSVPTTVDGTEGGTSRISLLGPQSVLGRALVVRGRRHSACCNIHLDEQTEPEVAEYSVHEARFMAPVAGAVYFRTYRAAGELYTTVLADLQHTNTPESGGTADSQHGWAIFVTDVLDTAADEARGTCNFLQLVYDPSGSHTPSDTPCSSDSPDACRAGNLTARLGHVRVTSQRNRQSRQVWSSRRVQLPGWSAADRRSVYLVLYDSHRRHADAIVACAKLVVRHGRRARAILSQHGVRGRLEMAQRSQFEPTVVTLSVSGLGGRARHFAVHQLPAAPPSAANGNQYCRHLGQLYNPKRTALESVAPAGGATHDAYPVGDLSGKHGELLGLDQFTAQVVDFNLPLIGARSVVGRSIVFNLVANSTQSNTGNETGSETGNTTESETGSMSICATLLPLGRQVRAMAVFRFPVGGRVVFTQPADDPAADTTVHVQGLVHTDGAVNATDWLRWFVRERVPGADFMNWTARCMSAGDIFNPHQVNAKSRFYYGACSREDMTKCELGDLTQRLGTLSVQAERRFLNKTFRLWTDTNLPLSGPHSVLGRSLVIHDDNGPRARGDRLACVEIIRDYRYKAVVKNWAYNMEPRRIAGKIEFVQESPFSATSTELDLAGLAGVASGYHVHLVPEVRHDVFPCHHLAVGGHYNPLMVDSSRSPPPALGSYDQYEAGDLSGKYGPLSDVTTSSSSSSSSSSWRRQQVHQVYNDTALQLFGSHTILGRSVVIHRAGDGARWACGTIGWGYSPAEARQVTAVASFHHPKGYAWGYVRFSQLVYFSGGRSETVIELNLRYPGRNDRNVSRAHNWAVYVNPVGHDAAVAFLVARCTAAGYRWNPDFVHLANPNAHDFYNEQCSAETPLRCEVGDLGGRLGPIDLGLDRVVMSDPNLPLDGDFWHSAVGKSLVIFEKDGGHNRMACANIELDYDLVKRVSIRKHSSLVSSKFIHAVREVMQAPEWFVFIDEQQTTASNAGRCVQYTVHFRGPLAQQLQLDFTRLFAAGRLDAPTVAIPGFHNPSRRRSVPYKLCGRARDDYQSSRDSNGYYIRGLSYSAASVNYPAQAAIMLPLLLAGVTAV